MTFRSRPGPGAGRLLARGIGLTLTLAAVGGAFTATAGNADTQTPNCTNLQDTLPPACLVVSPEAQARGQAAANQADQAAATLRSDQPAQPQRSTPETGQSASPLVSTGSSTTSVPGAITWGVNIHPEQPIVNNIGTYDATTDNAVLDRLQAAGVQMVRLFVPWLWVEPTGKGQYDQTYLSTVDTYVQAVRNHGMKLIITSSGSPCWATSYPTPTCVNGAWGSDLTGANYVPANLQDAADNAVFDVQRWAPDAIEIWNEPNNSHYLQVLPGQDPATVYTDLAKTIYTSVKAVSPGTTVVAGSLAESDTNFLQALYDDGIRTYSDAISIHPYNIRFSDPFQYWADPSVPFPNDPEESLATGVPAIHQVMINNGDGSKPLWLTEFGFSACDPNYLCLDEQTAGQYLSDALNMIRGWSYVQVAMVHQGWDFSSNMNSWNGFGAVRNDLSRRPVYCDLATTTGAITGCSPDQMNTERTAQDDLVRAWILARNYYLAHGNSFAGFGPGQLHKADGSFTGYNLTSYDEPTSSSANPKKIGIYVNSTGSDTELCNAAVLYAYCVYEHTGSGRYIIYGKASGNVFNAAGATNKGASTTW